MIAQRAMSSWWFSAKGSCMQSQSVFLQYEVCWVRHFVDSVHWGAKSSFKRSLVSRSCHSSHANEIQPSSIDLIGCLNCSNVRGTHALVRFFWTWCCSFSSSLFPLFWLYDSPLFHLCLQSAIILSLTKADLSLDLAWRLKFLIGLPKSWSDSRNQECIDCRMNGSQKKRQRLIAASMNSTQTN